MMLTQTNLEQQTSLKDAEIEVLIAKLNDPDGLVRHRARLALINLGTVAVEPLIEVLHSREGYTYWEATKALSHIGSPKTIQIFIDLLEDSDFSIRWLAAEGLITIGQPAVGPLLKMLEQQSSSVWLREGAHHIIQDLLKRELLDSSTSETLQPVLSALLHDMEPVITVPVAAWQARQALGASSYTEIRIKT